jgi:uncharacterized membrane protein (DUF485 family)
MDFILSDTARRDLAELSRRRRRFVLPVLFGALGCYLLVLAAFAYWPGLVRRHVVGAINVAYVLAFSQFVMTFTVGVLYARYMRRACDPLAERIRLDLERTNGDVAPDAEPRFEREPAAASTEA